MKINPENKKTPYVVVYKKPNGRKYYMKLLTTTLDDIINLNKRKPPIPHDYELIEIGWGSSFIDSYKEKYNIKTIDQI